MRKVLFWIVVTLFVTLAIYCFVVGMLVDEKAPWFMASFTSLVALFTSLLWSATNNYAETTKGLLNQSKEAFEQSNIRSLFDITSGLISFVIEQRLKVPMRDTVKHCKNRLLILARINPQDAETIWEALKIWGGEKTHPTDPTFEQFAEKEDADFKKKINLLKAGKKIRNYTLDKLK